MADPITIDPDEPLNPGLDYTYLKEEGLTLCQQLSGDIWTDYNEHDPGVTTLEQLCYALTELSYRAEIPLKDLLIGRRGGRIHPRRQALFPARRIFPCNPVTEKDYRKLVVDRVPAVANAWFNVDRAAQAEGLNGLYNIEVYAPGAFDDDCCANDASTLDGERCEPSGPEAVIDQVFRVYSHHRGLCEDVHKIRVLKPRRTVVEAAATLEGNASPEAILAGILFNLGNFFAPELKRHSLKSRIDAGEAPSEIFDGPLLLNGFIDDDQLQSRARKIPVQDVVRVIARSKGVASVRDVRVRTGRRSYEGNESIRVPRRKILEVDTRPDARDGGFSIRLFRDGIEVIPTPLRVERELARLWTDYRRTYLLAAEYNEYFPFPRGTYRDLSSYTSIQEGFPRVYGIGSYGLPEHTPPARQAQAKQFKGYLLVYDQLMADFCSQLAGVRDLFSTSNDLHQTYFFQSLEDLVPDVGPLLKKDYWPGLTALMRSQDPALKRRGRFLDYLLALYAERLDAASVSPFSCPGQWEPESVRLNRAKLALLHHLVESTRDRGRGFDYMDRAWRRNVAGMEIKSRIQLGIDPLDHRPYAEVLEELALELSDSNTSVGRPLRRHSDHIEESFAPVSPELIDPDSYSGDENGELSIPLLTPETVTEGLLRAVSDPDNYRLGSLPGDRAIAVVCKAPEDTRWRLLGKFPDREGALKNIRHWLERTAALAGHCQQLYIVEHILLRFGRRHDDPNSGFGYSFTISAVIAAPHKLLRDPRYRRFVRDVIRENTPAHVVVNFCFLNLLQLCVFEDRHWAWRRALRTWARNPTRRAKRRLAKKSAKLRTYLQKHQSQVVEVPRMGSS